MPLTLQELNKEIINSLPKKNYTIESEITGVSNRRGHTYFDFKEKNDKISGIIFNNKDKIEDGDKIKCLGRLSYYAPYGKLSFNVNQIISKAGLGDIYKDFLILKDKLSKDGVFNKARKKIITNLIEEVIIITSKQGAAIQDIYRNLSNHDSKIKVNVTDAPVQGINCCKEISSIINYYNKYKNKIIIITRGGGDYQDLNGFNQEDIVKSIYHNNNIIISAIGHDTDTVLSDLVADYSLPTPSLVAQFLIDHNNNLINNWKNHIDKLEEQIKIDIRNKYDIFTQCEYILNQEENNFDLWIIKIENDIKNQIYQQEILLNEYYNYLDNLGEIKLLNYKEQEFNNLEDIGQIFLDKNFFIKIKDRLFQISDFIVKEKII